MHIVTVAEMRMLEAQAEQRYGLSSPILMEHAGKSAADIFEAHLPPHHTLHDLEVLFLIGPGNNGGDGVIMAQHLEQAGAQVSLYRWKDDHLTVHGREIAVADTHEALESVFKSADYIIDALLGTGRSRALSDSMRALIAHAHQERQQRNSVRIVAIDLPTGLDADSGAVDPGAVRADRTITLACPKQGFFFFPGRDHIGDLSIGAIGLPAELEQGLTSEMLTAQSVSVLLPERPLNSNKGTFGKVMLFCGSPAYPGSAYLAGSAAGRVGTGLVTLAVTEQMLPIYASTFHESTFALLPPQESTSFERSQSLIEQLKGYRVLLMGPGLGQSSSTREVILQVLEHLRALPEETRPRLVIDADGLNNLAALERWWTLLPGGSVITPHPGEMGRLCGGLSVSGGDSDRLELVRSKASEWGVNVVLKGACTIIAEPGGRTRINWHANPALAAAGTGDVLAGMTAGLLAQRVEPFDAASCAVYLHSIAANLVSEQIGRAGLLASDLLPQIPRAIVKTRAGEPGTA